MGPAVLDGDVYTVRLADNAAQAFEVRAAQSKDEPKAPISLLRTVAWGQRQLLFYAFEGGGWSFGTLEDPAPTIDAAQVAIAHSDRDVRKANGTAGTEPLGLA